MGRLRWCFPAGTPVATLAGLRAIESVEAGEEVWAYDLVASRWRPCRVGQTFRSRYEGNSVFVTVAEATFRHPYWVVRGEELEGRPRLEHLPAVPAGATTPGRWVDAGDLRGGDELLLRHDPFRGEVYNFEVEDLHCYAVGRNSILVHNNNGPEGAAHLEALAPRRVQMRLPAAGTPGDPATLARLEINGQTFNGINRGLQSPPTPMTLQRVNAQTITHAEADVVQQAVNGGMRGTARRAEMWVDRDPCRACGVSGGLRSLARNLGVDELIVHSPSGTQTFTPTP